MVAAKTPARNMAGSVRSTDSGMLLASSYCFTR